MPYTPQCFPTSHCQVLASRTGGTASEPYPSRQAGRSARRQLAVSSSILRRESRLLSHPSSQFPVCSLPGFPSQPLSALAPACMLSISQGLSLGLDLLPKALQAAMNILAIPHWPQTPTLSATWDFLFFRSLAALHKLRGSVCHLHAKKQGCPLRPSHLLT